MQNNEEYVTYARGQINAAIAKIDGNTGYSPLLRTLAHNIITQLPPTNTPGATPQPPSDTRPLQIVTSTYLQICTALDTLAALDTDNDFPTGVVTLTINNFYNWILKYKISGLTAGTTIAALANEGKDPLTQDTLDEFKKHLEDAHAAMQKLPQTPYVSAIVDKIENLYLTTTHIETSIDGQNI